MKIKAKALPSAVRLAISLGAFMTVAVSGTAFAQDAASAQTAPSDTQNATQLKGVVVTGSLIRRVDIETASPVISVGRAAIQATGKLTVGDLLQELPAMTGGRTTPQVNNGGGTGASTLSLRGLGPKRSLILVDGHRVVSQDVNSIPANMIERIDVLTTGASSIYGSDAIGGVVNFITRKHYQGAQFTAEYGESSHDDGTRKGYTFTFGQASDKGNIIGGVGYNKMEAVPMTARKLSAHATSISAAPGTTTPIVFPGGSGSSPFGNIQIPAGLKTSFPGCASGNLAHNPGTDGMDPVADYHCYQNTGANSDKFNVALGPLLMTPQERTNIFLVGSYNLTDNVSAYLNTYYTKTNSAWQLGPAIYSSAGGANISADNYYNPFGVEYSAKGHRFQARLSSLGFRHTPTGTSLGQFSTGFKGNLSLFSRDWQWDIGMDYGHESAVTTHTKLPNLDALYTGPSFLDSATAQVTCGAPGKPIAGCDASFNPFVLESSNSRAALLASSPIAIDNTYSQQKVWHAGANGGLFDLPAGTTQLALGVNYRQEHTLTRIDPMLNIDPSTGTCLLGTACSSGLQGGFNVKEVFGELFVPILSDMPLIRSLNVTVGDRYSRFSTFGSTNNKKFAMEWKPIDDLLLRGTLAEVFRAPDIGEVFGAPSSGAPGISSDPCDRYTGSPSNPACVNVPTNGSFLNSNVLQHLQASVTSAGSAYAGFPIKPESGKTFDLGAVYSPSWITGLSTTVDFWHLYLNNIITNVGLQSVLNLCSAGQTVYCPFIHREASGPQQGQLTPLTIQPTGNLGSVNVSGVDASITYRLPQTSFGLFNFLVNATYLKAYNQETAPGTPANTTYHFAGHFMGRGSAPAAACPGANMCLFPRLRANGTVNWHMGDWSARWRMQYLSSFRMGSPSPSQDTHPAGPRLSGFFLDYGSTLYHNIQVGYDFKPLNTRLDIGVDNVFDKLPPELYDGNTGAGDTDARSFDQIGRYYWARVTVSF